MNSSYNPTVGDSLITIAVDTTGITQGSSGENRIWNFSSTIQSGSTELENFVVPSVTPYFSQFYEFKCRISSPYSAVKLLSLFS